jgi:hypothetical protein
MIHFDFLEVWTPNICAALPGDYPVQTVTITLSQLGAKYKHRDKTIL